MGKTIRYVGMDVHAATISVAVVEGRGLPRSRGVIENESVRFSVYEAGGRSSVVNASFEVDCELE